MRVHSDNSDSERLQQGNIFEETQSHHSTPSQSALSSGHNDLSANRGKCLNIPKRRNRKIQRKTESRRKAGRIIAIKKQGGQKKEGYKQGKEGPQKNGEEGPQKNGEEGPQKNGEEGPQKNGEEGRQKNGEEGIRLRLKEYPDYTGPEMPDCHFKLNPDRSVLTCRLCSKQLPFTAMASAKINQHMLRHHRVQFKARDLFSSPDWRQAEQADGHFHPKFIRNDKKRSLVWQLFLQNSQIHYAICSACWMTYNVRDGSTSGMLKHLQKQHEDLLQKKRQQIQASPSNSQNDLSRKRRHRQRLRTNLWMCQYASFRNSKIVPKLCMQIKSEVYGHFKFMYRNDAYTTQGFQ